MNNLFKLRITKNFDKQLFPDFKLRWLINEININLPLELDFFHEARNAEKLKKNFKNVKNVHVPEIVWVIPLPPSYSYFYRYLLLILFYFNF